MRGRNRWLMVLSALGLLLAACSSASQATPTATPLPARPTAGATPTATSAVAKPTATPVSAPTAAPSASKTPQYGGVLTMDAPADVDRFDRQMNPVGDSTAQNAWSFVYDKLAEWTWPEPGNTACSRSVTPRLAESWRWEGTSLVVKLRQGIKFQNKPPVNGREVTASDAAFALNRARDKQDLVRTDLLPFKITAADRYTIRFDGDERQSGLPAMGLASAYGVAPMAPESAGPDGTWDKPEVSHIGAGPFTFAKWVPGVKLSFQRNPDYWQKGLPYVDGLELLIIQDVATRMAAVRAGKLTLQLYRTSAAIVQALSASNPNLHVFKCPGTAGMGTIQIRNDVPPWNDVRVRRALFLAIDQDAIMKSVLLGEGFPSGAVLSSLPLGLGTREDYPPDVRKYLFANVSEAKRLLAEAGFPNGLDTSLEATRYYGSPANEGVEAVHAMLSAAGIRAKLVWLDRAPFNARRGNQDALIITSASASDPWRSYRRYKCDQPPDVNRSRVCSPKLDAMIEKVWGAGDDKELQQAILAVQVELVDQAHFYALPSPNFYMLAQPWVQGFTAGAPQDIYMTPLVERLWVSK